LEPIWKKYKDQGFVIVAVDFKRDRERALKFIEENGLTFKFLENREGDEEVISSVFGTQGFPTTYLIDRDGKIMYLHYGFRAGNEVEIEEHVVTLLGM